MLTDRESSVLACCRLHLDKIEPHPDYVGSGKFAVGSVDNPTRGKCYLASAAVLDFLGGVKAGYHLAKATNHLGDHYWVVNDHGAILDATREQFDILGERPPYQQGRRVGRRNSLKKHLPLLEAMRVELGTSTSECMPLVDIVGRPLIVGRTSVLSDAQEELLTDAYTALIADWAERPDEFLRCCFSKGALAVQFVRALLYGDEVSRTATIAYTPDRFYTAGNLAPLSDALATAAGDPRIIRGIRFILNQDISFQKIISSNLPVLGYRLPMDFPVSLAKQLIDKYCPVGGVVLDPCHGWGGRLIGFMLSQASAYVGIDPAPYSSKLKEMFTDLSQYLPVPKAAKFINKPFEDTVLSSESYDFALTSPPYFNTEKYPGDESSWRRYTTLSSWVSGFYEPLISGVAAALRPGAAFALQVTPKFRMVDIAKEVGASVGLEFEKVFDTSMRRYNTTDSGATELYEVVAIFRKASSMQ